MAAKRTLSLQVITNGVMTGTNVLTSTTPNTECMDSASVHFIWTGTPNGTFAVQGSNDNATWTDVTLSSAITAAGSASSALINLFPWPFKYFRCTYTNSSSTGTLNAYFLAKEQ